MKCSNRAAPKASPTRPTARRRQEFGCLDYGELTADLQRPILDEPGSDRATLQAGYSLV